MTVHKGTQMICPTCNNTPQKRGFDDKNRQRYWCRLCDKWLKEEVVLVQEEKKQTRPKIFLFDIETLPLDVVVWGIHEQHINHNQIINDWCVLSWAGMWLDDEQPVSDYLTPYEATSRSDKRILMSLWVMLNEV